MSSLELINCSPIGSDIESAITLANTASSTAESIFTAPAGVLTPRYQCDVDEDGFRFPSTGISCKSASAAMPGTPNWLADSAEYDDEHILKSRVRRATQKLEAEILLHRRSLSENIIHFPLHTSPSDKARCHQMQRQRSSTHSPTPPRQVGDPQTATVLLPTTATTTTTKLSDSPLIIPLVPAVLTLRKVGETMCLKDPQYKPTTTKDPNGVKPNPFTTLAQLRGVKKILGANPKTYAAGVGDLFSSCFEMSAPFFKELVAMQAKSAATGTELEPNPSGAPPIASCTEPKSLPASPKLTRKYSAIELKLPQRNSHAASVASEASEAPAATALPTPVLTDIDDCDYCNSEGEDLDGGGNCADAESSSDDSAVRPSAMPVARKYRANSLYTHPLFRGSSGTIMKYSNSELEVAPLLKTSNSANTLTSLNLTTTDMISGNNQVEYGKELSQSSLSEKDAASKSPPPEEIPATVPAPTDFELNGLKNSCDLLPTKRNLTRRDSIESGFFSCFNEESDAATTNTSYTRQLCGIGSLVVGNGSSSSCCYDQLKSLNLASNKLK